RQSTTSCRPCCRLSRQRPRAGLEAPPTGMRAKQSGAANQVWPPRSFTLSRLRLELAPLHFLEEMFALHVLLVVPRRRKRLIVAAALACLGQLFGLGCVLSHELGELFLVHDNLEKR